MLEQDRNSPKLGTLYLHDDNSAVIIDDKTSKTYHLHKNAPVVDMAKRRNNCKHIVPNDECDLLSLHGGKAVHLGKVKADCFLVRN